MKINKSISWAFASSIIAILLATAPGLFSLIKFGKIAPYQSDIAMLLATLLAVIWYTAYTYDILVYHKTKSQNEVKSLSTALLSELKWLFSILNEFAVRGYFSDTTTPTPLPIPILSSAIKNSTILNSECVHEITYLYRALNHFEHKRMQLGTGKVRETDSIRTYAAYICIAISRLVPLLKKEGGLLPNPIVDRAYGAHELPAILPANPFE